MVRSRWFSSWRIRQLQLELVGNARVLIGRQLQKKMAYDIHHGERNKATEVQRVAIVGGGIGGLSCAHFLSRLPEFFHVSLYESASYLGGQAGSSRHGSCTSEYAWRVWTDKYVNFLGICSEIPLETGEAEEQGEREKKQLTVRDNFVKLQDVGFYRAFPSAGDDLKDGGDSIHPRRWSDKKEYARLLLKLAEMFLMSDDRLREKDASFMDYIDSKDKTTIDWCHEFVGPILGLEATQASFYSVAKGCQATYMMDTLRHLVCNIYVTNAPYGEAIFEPWGEELRRRGVEVHHGVHVEKLLLSSNIAPAGEGESTPTLIRGAVTQEGLRIEADVFVLALDQMAFARLLQQSGGGLLSLPSLSHAPDLALKCSNMWFGMRLYFSRVLEGSSWASGTCLQQPWKPVVQRMNVVWKSEHVKRCSGAEEVWQVSVLDHVRSATTGKTLRECSLAEAVKETLAQVRVAAPESHWEGLLSVEPWKDWGEREGKLSNMRDQYKLSINSGGCIDFQPLTETEIPNLFVGGALVRTPVPMVSMEVACIGGLQAAHAIARTRSLDVLLPQIVPQTMFAPSTLGYLRRLDGFLFRRGLRVNMVSSLLFLAFLFVCLVLGLLVTLAARHW